MTKMIVLSCVIRQNKGLFSGLKYPEQKRNSLSLLSTTMTNMRCRDTTKTCIFHPVKKKKTKIVRDRTCTGI